jgi:hypothetical protein
MGWAERANVNSQDKKIGKLEPKPPKPQTQLQKLRERRLQDNLRKMRPKK